MNLHPPASDSADQTADRLAVEKFAVGQPVPRNEDPMLVRGKGRYTDDLSLPGQAYAVMVRSQRRARRHPLDRHRGRAQDAGRAWRLYRR